MTLAAPFGEWEQFGSQMRPCEKQPSSIIRPKDAFQLLVLMYNLLRDDWGVITVQITDTP